MKTVYICSIIALFAFSQVAQVAQAQERLETPRASRARVREAARAHARLIETELRLQPEYASIQSESSLATTLLVVGIGAGAIAVVTGLGGLFTRGSGSFVSNQPRQSEEDRELDRAADQRRGQWFLASGIAVGCAVASLFLVCSFAQMPTRNDVELRSASSRTFDSH